jgi:hypothetical protein
VWTACLVFVLWIVRLPLFGCVLHLVDCLFDDIDNQKCYTTTKVGAGVLHIGIRFGTCGFSVFDAVGHFLGGPDNMGCGGRHVGRVDGRVSVGPDS